MGRGAPRHLSFEFGIAITNTNARAWPWCYEQFLSRMSIRAARPPIYIGWMFCLLIYYMHACTLCYLASTNYGLFRQKATRISSSMAMATSGASWPCSFQIYIRRRHGHHQCAVVGTGQQGMCLDASVLLPAQVLPPFLQPASAVLQDAPNSANERVAVFSFFGAKFELALRDTA